MRHITEKKERSLGVKLNLKGDRCNSPKCVMIRRPYRPGMHGQARKQQTEFGRQLQEKQKLQLFFGLTNRQMMSLFKRGTRKEIIARLQQRLDQTVFLIGFVKSPRIARQIISHGHIHVNGRKVTVPSFSVTIGDVIEIRPESREMKLFANLPELFKEYTPPSWIQLNPEKLQAKCVANPDSLATPFQYDLNLVGQFYTK